MTTDRAFGTFNGFGYLRAPYSTTDAPRITRNPGRVANSPITWSTPLDDILTCTSPGLKDHQDWDLCINRLANGLRRVTQGFAGTFNDADTSYAPILAATVAVAVLAFFLVCCPLKRIICGRPKSCAFDGSVLWIGFLLVALTMLSTSNFHTTEFFAGASPAGLVALFANEMATRNVASGSLECPLPGSCIIGKTKPEDCACKYKELSVQQFLTLNQ